MKIASLPCALIHTAALRVGVKQLRWGTKSGGKPGVPGEAASLGWKPTFLTAS